MKYWCFILSAYLHFCLPAKGQTYKESIPFSAIDKLPPVRNFVDLSSTDQKDCRENNYNHSSKGFQFACPFSVNYNPDNSGNWTETTSGRIWRLGIRSKNANSLYLVLDYSLLNGARLFAYGPEYEDISRSYTYRDNNSFNKLTLAPIVGEEIIIELNLALDQVSFGQLNLIKVYHGNDKTAENVATYDGESMRYMSCNEDINCDNGQYWQTEKRSVCKIISGGALGTGVLVANTSGTNAPYVLTANHLISSPEQAAEALFVFDHETWSCGDRFSKSTEDISGATLVSNSTQVDFTLLQLNDLPSQSVQPFFAGWDATNSASEKSACIHHPFGNTKQIAIEYHQVVTEDIGQGFDPNSTWKVRHWELGTTEFGSSGAPLFNDQHQIMGTLTGGRSTCGYTRDDFFTKFGISWNSYSDPANQLEHWLDSAQTGHVSINGYDPYGFNPAQCDTAWNFFEYDRLELSDDQLTWGWISGHSSDGYTQFAERFEPLGRLQVNGIYMDVVKVYSSNPLSYIEVKIWQGDEYPELEIYSQLWFLRDLEPERINYLAFDSVLSKSEPFFVGYKIRYETPLDTFAVRHANDRGFNRPSSMFLFDGSWHEVSDSDTYGVHASLGLGISECYGKTKGPDAPILNVFPNPTSLNSVKLDMPYGLTINSVKCYDSSARPVPVILNQSESSNELHFNLSPGVYVLKVFTSSTVFDQKFIVAQ